MIPILYEKDEIAFLSNGLGRLRDCITCTVTEERNGIYECDFEYPVTGQNADKIQVGRIVAVEHDDSNDVQPFDIASISRAIDGIITVHCTHISYRQSYLTVTGKNINSLAAAFTLFGNASPSNPFSYWTDKSSTGYLGCAIGVPMTVRSMLGGTEGSILDTYGGEYEWDKFNVRLYASRGQQRDFTIRYGLNMTDYTDEMDMSGCYSSCIPYWTDGTVTVVGDKQTMGTTTPSGRDGCIPLDVSEKFENKPTKAQVNAMGLSVMSAQNPTIPAQNITVSFIRLQESPEYEQYSSLLKCGLCDTINVIFPMYNSSGLFKIVKTVWNVLGERYEEMELGDLSISLSEALGISSSDNVSRNTAIIESGTTSNSWDYRLWSDGTYEAWRSHGFTGMALTSSSAGTYYGSGTTLGVPLFPNNGNTGVLQCFCTANNAFSHSSGVYLYQVQHNATTPTAEMTFQFRAHASTNSAACGIDIYIRGTYT